MERIVDKSIYSINQIRKQSLLILFINQEMNILIPYNLNTSTFSASTKISQKQLNRINAGLKIKQSFASLSGGAVVLVYFRLDLHDGVDEEADDAGLVGRH